MSRAPAPTRTLMLFAEGSPARTSAPPAADEALAEPDPGSGGTSRASSRGSGRRSSSSKTSQAERGPGSRTSARSSTSLAIERVPSEYLPSTSERPTDEHECSCLLATPLASDGKRGATGSGQWQRRMAEGKACLPPLPTAARLGLLPTPAASRSGNNQGGAAGRVGPIRESLDSAARKGLLPTPTVNYNRAGLTDRSGDGLATVIGGPLSPRFVEWLMGFPDGWTDCEPSETPSSPSAPKSSGE